MRIIIHLSEPKNNNHCRSFRFLYLHLRVLLMDNKRNAEEKTKNQHW